LGVVDLREALRIADENELDLVEVAPHAKPPVCRIMDFGKYKYDQSKKQSHKKTPDVKEIKIRPRIDTHDLERKVNNLKRFLDAGHKAKITMFFRGRERGRPELGMKVFDKLTELLNEEYNIIQQPRHEGSNITMVIVPKSGKTAKKPKTVKEGA
jgi:translation initiation factor IF-3